MNGGGYLSIRKAIGSSTCYFKKEEQMKKSILQSFTKWSLILLCGFFLFLGGLSASIAAMPGFDASKISDMSDFDPNHAVIPTGDTIKIGLLEPFSGPSAVVGDIYWCTVGWVTHDINKRGGILVDGKKKLVELIKGDSQAKPAATKKVAERLCLEDKVDVIWGVSGSHLTLIAQNVVKKYQVIMMNCESLSDGLMAGENFNRYVFRTCLNTTMFGDSIAYFYAKRPETKFYILCQDYLFGHAIADAFKNGLKKYKPDAQIVGEAYHPLFLKDFAPYITKIQGSGAEVIYTGDWDPDASNLIKQTRELGANLPIANVYADNANTMQSIGGPAGVGMVNGDDYLISVDTPQNRAFVDIWHKQAVKWEKPYDTIMWQYPMGVGGRTVSMTYWLLDVIERAGTTDPEKIIETWEDDEYNSITGVVKMRACDHQAIKEMFVSEFVYPNKWIPNAAHCGEAFVIPPEFCMPPIPENLERCKK